MRTRTIVGGILAVGLGTLISGCGSTTTTTKTKTVTHVRVETVAAAPPQTQSTTTSTTAAAGSPKIGKTQSSGDLGITPTDFSKTNSNGSSVTWRATITVKNNGSQSIDPFCGGTGAQMTDDQGRTYDGKSVVNESGSANCGDAIQPGLSNSPYMMDFQAPPDAKPVSLALWGTLENQDSQQTWSVK